MFGKVSIIMPAYNCDKFIEKAIQSVVDQTYKNWELVIVDDCSEDDTFALINNIAKEEKRIVVLQNKNNMGAAETRNRALDVATGKYMAFLDSDDIWDKNKLEKQLRYMSDNNISFTCTSYNKIDEEDNDLGIIINAITVDYEGLLRRCPGNSTVIYNAEILGKHKIPDIKKRNDYLMWLNVIKKAKKIHGIEDVLSSHRIGMQSISSNKKTLLKYHWIIYRKIEKLPWTKCVYLCCFWVAKKVFRFQ